HAPYKVIYENLQTIEAQLKQALNLGQKITQTSNENDAINAGLPSLKKAVEDASKAKEAAQKDIENQDKELERINQAIEQCNPQELENEKKQLEDLEGKLRAAEKEMTSLDGKIEALNRLKKDIDDLKSEKEGKQQQLAKSKLELPSLETAYGIAKEVYENVKLSIDDAAVRLRAQIQAQHAKECPVCRQSLENVLIESEAALLGKMNSYKEKAEEAEKNLGKKNVEVQTLERGIADTDRKEKEKSNELEEAKKDYAVICASAVEKLGQLGINTVAESIDSAEAIEGLKESVAEKRGEYDIQRNSLNQRQQQLTTLQGEQSKALTQKTTLTTVKGEKDRDLQDAENKVKESEDKIKSNEQLVEQYREEREKCIAVAEEYLSGQANWQQSWSQNPKEYIEEWNKRNDAYKALVEDVDRLSRVIGDAEKTLQAVNGSDGSITTAMPLWQIDISGIVASRVSDNLQGAFSALDVSIATHNEKVGNYSKQRDEGRAAVDTFLSQNAEYDESLLRKLNELEGNRIEALKKAHEEVKTSLSATKGALESKQKEIDQHKGTPHSQESESLAIDELEARKNESDGKLTEMQKEQHENKFKLDEYNKKKEQLAKDQQEVDALRVKRDRWNTLDDIFGGMDGNNFKKKAQSYLLSFLLDAANAHLSYLEPRYKLESIPDTLTIVLHDNYRQNYNSPVDTLSGGESFLVSLALALALSTINNRGLAIDTLFIDEGFGTLGEPELNRVVELLENLQRHQGKRVGIISHVELLATRIPVQIQATRIDESRTTLNVVDTRLAKRC
ncbi:MAG: hypothetical protein II793_05755, partial [Bacteroidales bacterium]|nr:hypothetical protein [Bacteroidales bacterium]